MTTSQNGWPASPDPAAIGIAPCSAAGIPIGDGLAAGPATTLLIYVVTQVHLRVERLVPGTCWGYHFRKIIDGSDLSNHASGTAVDINADQHPLGVRGTFTPAQVDEIHRILAEVDQVVRWGGDYAARVDEMHFEINEDYTAVARVAARLEGHMARWADFSAGPPGAAALRQAGFVGVLRYIGLGREGKQIHRAEWEDYLRNGLRVVLVAELGVNDAWEALDDFATGAARARVALADLAAECPAGVNPDSVLIACAADAHASSAQVADAVRYAAGFASVIGQARAGFYGFSETSRAVHAAGVVGWHWRCGSEPSTADKQWVNFWQRNTPPQVAMVNGASCDINDELAPLGLTQEDDMTPQELIDFDLGSGWTLGKFAQAFQVGELGKRSAGELTTLLADLRDKPAATVTLDAAGIEALATGIVTDLAARGYNNVTPAQIENAVRAVFASAAQFDGSGGL